jgi:NTE family protein
MTADRIVPPRHGLVLGAGGALGAAWMVGALSVLAELEGYEPSKADVIVGTSAGSVVASLLACGVPVDELAERIDVPSEPHVAGTGPVNPFDVHEALATIPRPALLPGNLRLAARAAGRPHRHTMMTMAAALAPRGRGNLAPVAALIAAHAGLRGEWPVVPATWIVAMDFDSGRRIIFGRDGAPPASLPDAVAASCAAPGFFPPVVINDRRYVDGGAVSVTNADVLTSMELDDVLVLAPMATYARGRRRSAAAQTASRLRRHFTRRLDVEADRLASAGTRVRLLAPIGPDLEIMGINVMNPQRRREVFETALVTTREQVLAAYEAQADEQPDEPYDQGTIGGQGAIGAR